MERSLPMSNDRVIKRSFHQERLDRINSSPYEDRPHKIRTENIKPGTSSGSIINFVKGKMSGMFSGIKKLFNERGQDNNNKAPVPNVPNSPQFLELSEENLDLLSASMQQVFAKDEYQGHYSSLNTNQHNSSKKAGFLDVVEYYKNLSTEKVREQMKESNNSSLNMSLNCQNRPNPQYSAENSLLESRSKSKIYLGKAPYRPSASNSQVGKTQPRSILHPHGLEHQNKNRKSVSFVNRPELRRVSPYSSYQSNNYQTASSVIKYSSSDDEQEEPDYVDETTQKKLFTENKVIIRMHPKTKVSKASSNKIKYNHYEKKSLERASTGNFSKVAKAEKKQFSGDYYKYYGKYNNDNSDNIINDSKIETDSDDQNLQFNNSYEPQSLNSLTDINGYKNISKDKYESSSDVSERIKDKKSSNESKLDDEIEDIEHEDEIEEQGEVEGEELNFDDEEDEKEVESVREASKKSEETASPTINETKPAVSSLFGSLNSASATATADKFMSKSAILKSPEEEPKKSIFGNLSESTELKPLISFGNNKTAEIEAPKVDEASEVKKVDSPAKSSIFASLNSVKPAATETSTASKFSGGLFGGFAAPVTKPESSSATEGKVEQTPTIIKPTEEALKNPLFANVLKQETQVNNNPFLNASAPVANPFVMNTVAQPQAAPVSSINEVVANTEVAANTTSIVSDNKPKGILELLGNPQSNNSQDFFSNNLVSTTGGFAWMKPPESSAPKQNLFGGFTSNANQAPSTDKPQTPQNSLFGSGFSNNNQQPNSMSSMSNNNSNYIFGDMNNNSSFNNVSNNNNNGGNMLFGGFNNNSSMGTLGQQNNNTSMFGNNNNNVSDFGAPAAAPFQAMGTSNQSAMGNNPFLAPVFGSGIASNNNNNASSSLFGTGAVGGGGTSFLASSGKKGKNHKERAF